MRDKGPVDGSSRIRRRLATACIAVLLTLLVLIVYLGGALRPEGSAPERIPPTAADARAETRTRPTATALSDSDTTRSSEARFPHAPDLQRSVLVGESRGARVQIRFVDTASQHVPDVRYRCVITSHQPGSNSDPARPPKQWTSQLKADEHGMSLVNVALSYWIRIELASDEWHCAPLELQVATDGDIEVRLRKAASVRFAAQYDDGQPVTYMGSLSGIESDRYWTTFGLSSAGIAVVPRIPVDRPLRCRIFAGQRIGYTSHEVVFAEYELASGRELLIIVPRDERPLGGIRVDFPDGAVGFTGWIRLESHWGTNNVQFFANMPSVEIGHLEPGKQYRATILGGKAWRSDFVEVRERETTVLKVVFSVGATIKARLLDSDGKPIANGALRVSDGDYLQFVEPTRPLVPLGQRSNAEGHVALRGVPHGEIELEAEAWGMELSKFSIVVSGGGTVDLGDVILPKASGEVTVDVVGMRNGVNYAVHIGRGTDGGTIFPYVPFEAARVTVSHLPLRTYRIGVTFAKGGRVVSELVELSREKLSATVQIDVTDLSP